MTEILCDHCKKPIPPTEVWGLAELVNGKGTKKQWDLHKACYDKIASKIEKE